MRKRDKDKLKAAKTINFDGWLLKELEEKARKEDTTVSTLVNFICTNVMQSEMKYAKYMAKYHHLQFMKWQYVKEEIATTIETGGR